MIHSVIRTSGIFLLAAGLSASEVSVDWLYLTPSGSWLSRSTTLVDSENSVQLPVAELSQQGFWWQSSNPNTQVWWPSPERRFQPRVGAEVSAESLTGRWFISDVNDEVIVLTQGLGFRYWPKAQWHLLTVRQPNQLDSLALTVRQPLVQTSQFDYAWHDQQVMATVQYQLLKQENGTILRQELLVSNQSQYDIKAPGYSYAAINQGRSMPMMTRAMALDSMEMSAPSASESEGISTLISQQPLAIPAQTQVWLSVAKQPIERIERQYHLSWDTRQQGSINAQSRWLLTSSEKLPEIPGQITVAVFDQQIAALNSYYHAQQQNQVTLDMGSSNLVNVRAIEIAEGRWRLLVSNRTSQDADVSLAISHWDGKRSQSIPVTFAMSANSERTVQVELNTAGQITVGR